MKDKHITFDLETLGINSRAPIVQIAAVKFNESNGVYDSFTANIKPSSLQKYNFEVDYNTIYWWMSQSKTAKDKVFNMSESIDIQRALLEFKKWIGKDVRSYKYWSHKDFDVPKLIYAASETGVELGIPFTRQQDIRTLTLFAGDINVKRNGEHHNALDDCVYQAEYILQGIKQIKNGIRTDLNWIEFDEKVPHTYPPNYGKYLVIRKDNKVHFETWNNLCWAYNNNNIKYWAKINTPFNQ